MKKSFVTLSVLFVLFLGFATLRADDVTPPPAPVDGGQQVIEERLGELLEAVKTARVAYNKAVEEWQPIDKAVNEAVLELKYWQKKSKRHAEEKNIVMGAPLKKGEQSVEEFREAICSLNSELQALKMAMPIDQVAIDNKLQEIEAKEEEQVAAKKKLEEARSALQGTRLSLEKRYAEELRRWDSPSIVTLLDEEIAKAKKQQAAYQDKLGTLPVTGSTKYDPSDDDVELKLYEKLAMLLSAKKEAEKVLKAACDQVRAYRATKAHIDLGTKIDAGFSKVSDDLGALKTSVDALSREIKELTGKLQTKSMSEAKEIRELTQTLNEQVAEGKRTNKEALEIIRKAESLIESVPQEGDKCYATVWDKSRCLYVIVECVAAKKV